MADLLSMTASWLDLGDDPLLVYSLAAAALLAFVSLVSGLGRLDLAALLRPLVLLRLCAAVGVAFALVATSELLLTDPGQRGLLQGAARFPLYLMALAYGPTVGLAAGALFAAATAVGPFPGWREAILCLELVVLGWLAIYPSPRSARWAGPLGAALAHLFAAGTAGVAFLAWRDGDVTLAALLAEQRAELPGLLVAWLLLALASPRLYATAFPGSRIAPAGAPGSAGPAEAAGVAAADGGRETRSPHAATEGSLLGGLEPLHRPPRERKALDAPHLKIDEPNA